MKKVISLKPVFSNQAISRIAMKHPDNLSMDVFEHVILPFLDDLSTKELFNSFVLHRNIFGSKAFLHLAQSFVNNRYKDKLDLLPECVNSRSIFEKAYRLEKYTVSNQKTISASKPFSSKKISFHDSKRIVKTSAIYSSIYEDIPEQEAINFALRHQLK